MVQIGVLGPVSLAVDGRSVGVRSLTLRRALVVFAIHANEVISDDRLADVLWPDTPPGRLEHAVHTVIYRLRHQCFGEADTAIVRSGPGYHLEIGRRDVDRLQFEDRLLAGRELEANQPGAARDQLVAALRLWRGDPLMDVAYEPWALGEIRRLEELHLSALESLAGVRIALGQSARAVSDLELLTEEHPLRESLWVTLWRALRAEGRHAEVSMSHRRATAILRDRYSLAPSPALDEAARSVAR